MHPEKHFGMPIESNDFEFPLVLPQGQYKYRFKRFSWIDEEKGSFVSEFRLNIHAPDELKEWRIAFESMTLIDLKTRRGSKPSGRMFTYKEEFMCQHAGAVTSMPIENPVSNKYGNRRRRKRINCNSWMSTAIRNISRTTRIKYPDLDAFPVWIKIRWDHNHTVHCAKSLSHRQVSQRTLNNLQDMFMEGLGCQQAYSSCRNEIRLKHADSGIGQRTLESALADSSICPTFEANQVSVQCFRPRHLRCEEWPRSLGPRSRSMRCL